jgi:hypothetical protein
MLESRGIATVVIGLIRPHMERTRPPRGLWVPFELGRPLGEPGDAAFQRRVLTEALALLERRDGPVILEDFSEDAPGWLETPDWRPAVATSSAAAPAPGSPGARWREALAAEIAAIRPVWQAAQKRFGRTTVGISSQPPEAWSAYACAFLDGAVPASPVARLSPALALRFLVDDLKACYFEAAQSAGPAPSSRQLNRWFWQETIAARLLQALRVRAMASDDNALKAVGSRFFVPAPYVAA